jgi:hypothetical protein
MPGTSFYYAIFKRFQATFTSEASFDLAGHMATNPAQLWGGFSLIDPEDPHGLLTGTLSNAASASGLAPGSAPLAPVGDNAPTDSPVYQMLAQSIGAPGTVPIKVNVAGQNWPVMPPPEQILPPPALGTQTNQLWMQFNTGNPPPLISAFGQWLMAGRPDDTPKGAISQPTLAASPPPAFPGAKTALLFVASFAGDDGRRFGDGEAAPGVPKTHVPNDFWAHSQIFLCNAQGQVVMPAKLLAGQEYAVAAVLGNSSTGVAGSTVTASLKVTVQADAQCFNTFMSPSFTLPSLGNLDPADPNTLYEQFVMRPMSWDVAGFRFNVSTVFSELAGKLDPNKLGGKSPAEWLKDGHPCVKVRLFGGEQPNFFPPSDPDPPKLDTSPQLNRHIAQRNLAPFDTALMAIKKPMWINFIVSQAGHGLNGLAIEAQNWPQDQVRFWFGLPHGFYERYVAKAGHRGFELVREGVPKPFPDCVLLRQATPGARLIIEDHEREGYFGMALGVAGDPAHLGRARLGDVAVAHTAHDGTIVGGFSLRPQAAVRT